MLLDWGLELTVPITVEIIDGQEVFVVEETLSSLVSLIRLNQGLCAAIAQRRPLRAVFRDSGIRYGC